MPNRLLWICSEASRETFAECTDHFSDLSVSQLDDIAKAHTALLAQVADCVLITGPVGGMSSLEVLEFVQSIDSCIPVIFCEEEMPLRSALQLIRAGAFHCSTLLEGPAVVRGHIDQALEEQRVRRRSARCTAGQGDVWRANLIGDSPAMEEIANLIRQIGPRKSTVLISGETGTGKEVVARALHMAGPRAWQPFVAINCSALPEHLLEAEIFGHVKGAFTGAINHRVGRFEQANKGTLFLDEIGDMPMDMQAKLLRVLQEREIQRLGGSETVKIDARVIAASNLDLLARVREGKFREDLYYRLNVVPIHLSPLRTRAADIPLLVYHFVKKVCQSEGISLRRLSPEAMSRLQNHAWPGNVRQLENAVERAIVLSGDRDVLTPADFGMASAPRLQMVRNESMDVPDLIPEGIGFETAVSRFEAGMLMTAMKKTGGNKTAAAELLGLKRTTLIMKLRNFESSGEPILRAVMAS